MQQGDNHGRFVGDQTSTPRYVMPSETPPSTSILGASGGVASQPPPYPGTRTLPSMSHTFSQRHSQHPELETNIPYQSSSLHGQGSYNLSNRNYNLHLGSANSPSSPGPRAIQQNICSLSPGAVGVPRKSLAGMISPIRQQPPPPLSLNMPPPSSPVVMGGRVQRPLSPLSVYMSQSQSPQRRTTVSHMSNVSARCYPPQQTPGFSQDSVSYNFSPQTHQIAMQRSPIPSPMYVDPPQQGQLSPMIPHSPHHSPKPVSAQGSPSTPSPYRAARHLNMSGSPTKSQHYMPSGDVNSGQWQYGPQSSGHKAMWENVNVTPLAPLPVLSSDTLDLLSTLTVSTVSSPIEASSTVTVAESQLPKSTLLEKHLLMPATPIRTTGPDRLLAIADPRTSTRQDRSDCSIAPPSRSDSKLTAMPTPINISENVMTKPIAEICCSTATKTASVMTYTKVDDPSKDKMTATQSIDSLQSETHAGAIDGSMSGIEIVKTEPVEDLESDAMLIPPEIIEKRMQLCDIYRTKLQERHDTYKEYLTELFFLRNGGNFMNYIQFKKRPSTKLLEYLKSKLPDLKMAQKVPRKTSNESANSNNEPRSPASDVSANTCLKTMPPENRGLRKRSISHEDALVKLKQQKQSIKSEDIRPVLHNPEERVELRKLVQSKPALPQTQGQAPSKLKRLTKQSTAAQLDESIGSQEEILERAKQEAVIQRKVVELRKQGLWTQRRLPKVQEPPRSKTHWDYLLEEMRWLSADFAQERKWKRAAARKLVRAVTAFHKEQHDQERRAKREEQNRMRRIASTMAREIRIFWGNVEKVVEYKQRSLLDEKRQKALDLHLSYIVDQTEKYSDWLTKGLNKPTGSIGSGSPSHSLSGLKSGSDDDFLPQGGSSDDEETIAVAEQELGNEEENEVSLLKRESELPFDELLSSLPEDLIENIGKPLEETTTTTEGKIPPIIEPGREFVSADDSSDEANAKPNSISLRRSARKRKIDVPEELDENRKKVKVEQTDDDKEFDVKREEATATDDESTIAMEEECEKTDYSKELDDLRAQGDMPIEELMKMYGAASEQDEEDDGSNANASDVEQAAVSHVNEPGSSESEDAESGDESEKEEIGMDYLFKADTTYDDIGPMIVPVEKKESGVADEQNEDGSPSKEITDVAAEAASLQPTGFTLATTQVVTPIPVLLKHTLREYQHIGLDWLVTMYDKRLNGILADEMGLGKTIQTIALLAHLACDKGVWGPHLIVVPTSVMLNWEMEFKKWCPGFKILTYYGSQKERKAKRTGWTKSNAFHVCITSYKLVLQDNASFRRKKWKYLVLDEAQNIKNFKSQRWQTLLNFNSQRRLLLTGTPLQNNLMELWSLMHFLMPHVFQSHKEFKEWFSNPLTGMIEGGQEYNEKLVQRLHKVLRPFLLRRMKKDVEKQMPNKYEHVIRCHLSKRQRFLYDDFMSQASTKDTLETGHFMSVINILMQLRKVCNHPNLFEPRPIVSPFFTDQMSYHGPSLITKVMEKSPFEMLNLQDYHMHLPTLSNIRQADASLLSRIRTPRKLIEELGNHGAADFSRGEQPSKVIGVKEQLANLLKEREKVGRSPQQTAQLHSIQPVTSLPLLTIPITSGTGSIQLNSSSATALVPSRVITLPQSKPEDTISGKSTSQGFTLQYQTAQGTRVAIPNKQIRQLAGGIVKIVTPTVSAKAPAPNAQSCASSPSRGAVQGRASSNADKGKVACEMLDVKDPGSYLDRLEKELRREHRDRCARMAAENEKRCQVQPEWLACDTIQFLRNIFRRCDQRKPSRKFFIGSGVITELVKSAECRTKEFKPITDRFAFVIPLVEAKPVDFHVSHPPPSTKAKSSHRNECLQVALKESASRFHSIDLSMRIQFPEARLIQYDCGKLQVLDVLLRRFYTEKHKCLIFTQMTKVLDILEAFLSYHGYRYLRLDGSTKVEQRMLLMERFNNDPRIFCFILSTRSGGIGVNLTGADTVIFYDSDWNPTMDAQAQDRCHRIGQTRDVHIYRLISERTVEENILKKANQKRLLGDIAIEGGSFTTAFFKEQAIKDLFNEPTGLEDMPSVTKKKAEIQCQPQAVLAKPVTARQKAIAAAKEPKQDKESDAAAAAPKKEPTWEDALQQTEDKEDVDAAKQLQEEQDADLEEFTENAEEDRVEGSRVHEEMKLIYEELTPIEKYALRYLEETTQDINREELELADEQVHQSKQDWELAHLVALKEEEERRLEEEDEIFYTREDAENQMYLDDVTKERMPIWFPPTPPQDDNDVYIDPIMALLYIPGPMSDDLLPVVQVKNPRKRARAEADSSGLSNQRKKIARTELMAPKSLFNRQTFKKREVKTLKSRREQAALSQVKISSRLPLSAAGATLADKDGAAANVEHTTSVAGTSIESVICGGGSSKNPDWLVNEDLLLLQAVQQVLEIPLSLCILMPAHTPNWDVVADIVNTLSSIYRSPKMCKQRFENEIAKKEEIRTAGSDVTSVKKKGTKTPTKPKLVKIQKAAGVNATDNSQYCKLYGNRFETIQDICGKRTAPVKSSGSGQFQRNPKHANILTEHGISFDKPFNPEQVAEVRANRIQREKEAVKQQQQIAQSQTMHNTSGQHIASSQISKSGISSIGQLTAIPLSGTSTANIIVNTSAFKKIGPHSVSKTTISSSALQQTLLRSASTGDQSQIQIQGQGTNVVSVGLLQRLANPTGTALVTSVTGSNSAITLSSLARPSNSGGAIIQGPGSQHLTKQLTKQHKVQQQILHLQKQSKKITKNPGTPQKLQITSEAMKKLRQQQQQMEGNIVTVAKVPGKARGKGLTTQELEQILKNQPIQRATTQKTRTTQVQIAPVYAQAQAQQVQEAAAQQAAQHIVTSKPLPLTVSVSGLVSAVNLSGISTSLSIAGTSGQSKSLVMTAPIQQQLQRQFMKQRMVSQQGQGQQQTQPGQVLASKVGMKQTVYAMVAASPQLVTQNKRRVSMAAAIQGGSNQQTHTGNQPMLTVTKLLHAQTMQGQPVQMKQSIAQGSDTLMQQVRQQTGGTQQLQMGQATIIPSSIAQQCLITPQRQIRQLHQPTQMILTPTSGQQFLQRQANQSIVASLSISAATSTAGQHPVTLSSSASQSVALTQQLQSLLNPQIIRAQTQNATANQTTIRNIGQQHHLVLQQQPALTVSQQTAGNQIIASRTSTTLVPSLVLPVSAVARSQTQTTVSDTSTVQFVPKTASQ